MLLGLQNLLHKSTSEENRCTVLQPQTKNFTIFDAYHR